MTHIYNDPARFREEALAGFVDLYAADIVGVPGGVVRAGATPPGKVAVVIGGGSGHYPAFCGLVGPGFADGAVVGNIFTSPSVADVSSVVRAAAADAGALLMAGNYAGDVLNFTAAAEQLTADGIDTRTFFVTDDIASAPVAQRPQRRGIAGDFAVFRIASAAAEAGWTLDEVERVAVRANDQTRSLGVGFAGCTLPGAESSLFTVPPGVMQLGLGIHGEAGIADLPTMTARALADRLVSEILDEGPRDRTDRVAVILNGLGATNPEELFIVWHETARLLRRAGLEIVGPEVGELVTSLDMAGCSLTVTWLTDQLETLWCAPAHTPAFRKGTPREPAPRQRITAAMAPEDQPVTAVPDEIAAIAAVVVESFEATAAAIARAETELGQLDAVAGDGDHGRGMTRGTEAARQAARTVAADHGGPGDVLTRAGRAWAAAAGGTSGMLWGAALEAAGEVVGNERIPTKADLVEATRSFVDTVRRLGKAQLGDKTMVDAIVPFQQALTRAIDDGEPLATAWATAAEAARAAAENTRSLAPRVGRARPLAARSAGHPDPGAMSFAVIAREVAMTTSRAILKEQR